MRRRTRSPCFTTSGSVPGKTRLLKVKTLKSIITVGSGVDVPGLMNHSFRKIAKSRSTRRGGVPRMEDQEAHHPHRHLHHLVEVRVVHLRAVLPDGELVLERLARLDARLVEPGHAVHAVRQEHAVPVHGRRLGQPVLDVDAHAVALDGLDRRARASGRCSPSSSP